MAVDPLLFPVLDDLPIEFIRERVDCGIQIFDETAFQNIAVCATLNDLQDVLIVVVLSFRIN